MKGFDDGWDDEPDHPKVLRQAPRPTNDPPPSREEAAARFEASRSREMGTPEQKIAEIGRPKYGDLINQYGYSVYDVETGRCEWWGSSLERVTELVVRKVGHEGLSKVLEIRDGILVTYPKIYQPKFRKE